MNDSMRSLPYLSPNTCLYYFLALLKSKSGDLGATEHYSSPNQSPGAGPQNEIYPPSQVVPYHRS